MREIPKEQVLRRIATENPWWSEPFEVPAVYRSWRPRPYLDLFFPLATARRVRRAVVLLGPRRVGKTVMLHHTVQRLLARGVDPRRIAYFSVDHPLYNGLGLEHLLDLFSEATGTPLTEDGLWVFFDEVQYLRDWEVHLKSIVDTWPGIKCVASGSAAAALKLKSAESGAGRFTDFLLPPLTFHEYLSLLGEDGLVRVDEGRDGDLEAHAPDLDALNERFLHYLNFGGYPEVVFSEEIQADPGRFVKADIIDKVLLRDLPSLYGIQDVQELNSLFTALAFNTAGEVSLEELSKSSGVAKNTIKRYVEYLEAAFLIRIVHRVDEDARHFRRANFFKVYLTNPSMKAALFSPLEAADPAMGALVETAVFSQWFHSNHLLHYARWSKGEVDLVSLDPEGKVEWVVETKWSDRVADRPEEIGNLLEFCRRNRVREARVTTRTRRGREVLAGIEVQLVPAAEYCFTVGRNLILSKV